MVKTDALTADDIGPARAMTPFVDHLLVRLCKAADALEELAQLLVGYPDRLSVTSSRTLMTTAKG